MDWEQLRIYLPVLSLAAGLLLLAYSERDRLVSLLASRTPPRPAAEPSPTQRFALFLELRSWCEAAEQTAAVDALDRHVLPALVRGRTNG